jgi:glutaredoxin-related protein
MVKLYTTHCPKCNVLTTKLNQKEIKYKEITDIEIMKSKGYVQVPVLEVDNKAMNFSEANAWINQQ